MTLNPLLQTFSDETTDLHALNCTMLRIDLLHPVVSGNKLFKLKFYLEEAMANGKSGILTFGGTHSNHLVATAFAAKESGMHSMGIVRGEKPKKYSPTLDECTQYGMELRFIPRTEFDTIDLDQYRIQHAHALVIPHGGYGVAGANGAAEILNFEHADKFDFIVAACGTGTMAAGLISAMRPHQHLYLISVLKNNFSIQQEIDVLLKDMGTRSNAYSLVFDYHLGGYAKKNKDLFNFMNHFFEKHKIPTDFVYTGKMTCAFYEMVKTGAFPKGSNVLLIHSGGLQGNRSLTNQELMF